MTAGIARERCVVNGLAVRYALEGAGADTVTFSHSLGATLELWDAQAAAVSRTHRVLRYDTRGHGGTSVPPGPYTLAELADDVAGLLDALGIARTHFVGLSMGGLVGMTLALRHPARVASLVLADTTACYGAERHAMWNERIAVAETAGLTEALIEHTMAIWFSAGFRERERAAVDRVRAMLRATSPAGYTAAIRAIGYVDLREALGAVRCPTLVLVGADDPGTPPVMAETLRDRIPGARLAVLPGAMHASCVEAAPAFNQALAGFLGGR